MMRFRFLYLLTAFFFCVSCLKKNNNENNCSYDPCAYAAPASEITQLESYLSANSITAVKHCSGLYYTILNEGTGSAPTICSAISITYKGTLTNGNVFDKSTTPVAFGLATLIEGWKKGLPLIKIGGKIKLYIPPSLGYGATGQGAVPPNAILIFDIDLLDVR